MMIKKSVLKDIINDHKKCLFADFVLDFFLISLYTFFSFHLFLQDIREVKLSIADSRVECVRKYIFIKIIQNIIT